MSEEESTAAVEEPGLGSINIETEMERSYIDYSMSVIVGRALPDARDGFKPVHRRVLYTLNEMGITWNSGTKKSARVVGEVMGKYHPHGDSAIYDTMVRLAQDFSMRYPLVFGQGNFGSVDGDPPAAMRYTEVKMMKIAAEMLQDLDKDTVDMVPNYDGELLEPTILPAKLPNLLLNGSVGIAVGMATNIPPHNLTEICDGIAHYIDNPKCSIDELMQFVKGPDFPTGGEICGRAGIEAMYKLGRGGLLVRGKSHFEKTKSGKDCIIVTEIPYQVNKSELVSRIAQLVNDKVITDISDVADQTSDKGGMRIYIELKKGAFPEVVLNQLYKHTQLQTTFGAIMLALDQGRPKVMNLKDLVRCYVDHRFEVITRRCKFELKKTLERLHIVEGLLIALDNMDEVISIIRSAPSRDVAKNNLVERFAFSDRQVNAILEMRLYQLTGLERDKVLDEKRRLDENAARLREILADPARVYQIIKDDLAAMKEAYAGKDQRRTALVELEGEVRKKDLIADEPCVITLSRKGYVKRTALSAYRQQGRGGKGITGASAKDEDYITTVFVAATHDTLLYFTTFGRVFTQDAYELPELDRTSAGRPIVNFLKLQEGEQVTQLLPVRGFSGDAEIFFATENGTVKKTKLSLFSKVNCNGIRAINLDENDRLVHVALCEAGQDIFLVTQNGKGIRFSESCVRSMGRTAAGVRGIRLLGDDKVCGFDAIRENTTLLVVTENGYGKRTDFEDFTAHNRGGQGITAIKGLERNGKVVGAFAVEPGKSLVSIGSDGMMVRQAVDDISVIGRAGKGVILVRFKKPGVKIVSCSIADAEEPAEEVPPAE